MYRQTSISRARVAAACWLPVALKLFELFLLGVARAPAAKSIIALWKCVFIVLLMLISCILYLEQVAKYVEGRSTEGRIEPFELAKEVWVMVRVSGRVLVGVL